MINLDSRLLEKIPEIGADAFAILLLIAKRINSASQGFPSVETLEKESGFGRNKVFKCLKKLKDHKLLASEQRRKNNKLTSNLYTVLAEGLGVYIPAKGVQLDDSLCTENEYTEENQQDGGVYQNNDDSLCTHFEDTENEYPQNQTRSIKQSSLSIKQSSLSIKKEKIYKKEKPKTEIEAVPTEVTDLLDFYNQLFQKSVRSIKGFEQNYWYWRQFHTIEKIEQALVNARQNKFWRDKMTLTILFRKKNRNGESVDYIEDLSSRVAENQGQIAFI